MTAHAEPRLLKGQPTRLLCWTLLLACLACVVLVQREIDGRGKTDLAFAEVLYMPSGSVLRSLSLGYEGLLADIYWTRVVQYFGRKKLAGSARLDLLGPLLQITTTLDPHLLIAYRFGAVFLAEAPPGGAGRPEQALDLLRRGIVANPHYWRLWQDVGFIYYWDLKDYPAAARAFETGSEQQGALPWMKVMAATVLAKGGDIPTSRQLWLQIYQHSDNEDLRRSALDHLAALKAKEDLDFLDRLGDQFRRRYGRPPRSIGELVVEGLLPAAPRDPSGASYAIGPGGSITLGPDSRVNLGLLP